MNNKIPELKSRYIPVHGGLGHLSKMHWWKNNSFFIYPSVLMNLEQFNSTQMEEVRANSSEELFLLCDSGGFQVITGTCSLNWETSLLKQIELGATKIFAFDKPPVKPKFEGSLNEFTYMNEKELKEIIEDNISVALKQSSYLKEKYPDELNKFCYIMHGQTIEHFNYNLEVLKNKYGITLDNYLDYFPGGVVYAAKNTDILMISMSARHAYENFIKRDMYVHFLGMGSLNRMFVLIRNEITTFDSSTILQGVRANTIINPLNTNSVIQIKSDSKILDHKFCSCPVCINVDYKKMKEENPANIARYFCVHNLWYILKSNLFLNSIPNEIYTETVLKNFKLNEKTTRALEFCDECDVIGFDLAYNKYKHFLKKDETKQKSLF